MAVSKRTKEICALLDSMYGTKMRTYLEYEEPWQLLFSTIMSAQCTDERVNKVAEILYKKYTSLQDFADCELAELENDIRSTGFYRNKAKNIKACAKELITRFNGEVPSDIDLLVTLPGVGRKTANVIRGNIFGIDSVVVDTHVKRVSKRLGFTQEEDPEKIEYDLMKKLPKERWILWNLQIISFGREICLARSPKCDHCKLKSYCVEKKG